MLEAPDEVPIVIERKSIVWPPGNEYLADHHKSHQLLDDFVGRLRELGHPFTESLYQLSVRDRDLKGRSQREVAKFAGEIADSVLSDPVNAKTTRGVGQRNPIPWNFRALSTHERDETAPETGIGIQIWEEDDLSEPFDIRNRMEEQKSGYASELERWASDAAEKFARYSHCRKLFLVQFFGDSSVWLEDEKIVEIVRTSPLPEIIDEVWVARQDWVSLDEYEVVWEQIR